MSFEQHPYLFWCIIALITVVGGYVGATVREFVHFFKERRWARKSS